MLIDVLNLILFSNFDWLVSHISLYIKVYEQDSHKKVLRQQGITDPLGIATVIRDQKHEPV